MGVRNHNLLAPRHCYGEQLYPSFDRVKWINYCFPPSNPSITLPKGVRRGAGSVGMVGQEGVRFKTLETLWNIELDYASHARGSA